ncbi:hypothetical protein [Microbacterium sp. K24]|uniref:hypothetical protein n=1 Tax=Microbacterium sp. K24 TaxID=2305446 RepID=UPI00109C00E9|nr:hypothetical protein [Microbacterium sp. K24]
MKQDLQIRATGGLVINAAPIDGIPAEGGFYVTRDGFVGWEDSTEPRGESIARPAEHGDFDFEVMQSARVVSVEGVILAPTGRKRVRRGNHLRSIGADGSAFQVDVELFGESTWATARRGTARVTPIGIRQGFFCATFSWQFVCRDPRRFGAVESFDAGVPVTQLGNFPAWPSFTVTGAAPGYTINGPGGRRIVVTRALVAGHPHRIDTSTGGLVIDGVRVEGGISVWEPWTIDPGLPGVTHTITAGTLLIEVPTTFV